MSIRWSAMVLGIAFVFLLVCASATQAQAQFSIRAASVEPVDGWQQMQVEHCQSRCFLWVSPTATIVASDIEKAEPEVRANGDTVIRVVFTDAGANKLHDLIAAQFKNFIAMIVDDKVIWAPRVNYVPQAATKKQGLTGNTSQGLTQEEVELIMAALRK